MASQSVRQSNFELFRIVLMAGVLLNHALQSLWNIHVPEIALDNEIRVFLLNSTQATANCFIMISGYFMIKLTWRGVLKYYFQCFFYSALLVAVSAIVNQAFSLRDLVNVVFACSEGSNWFIQCYFALMLISPLLNKAIQIMSVKELRFSVLMFLIVDVYVGYMHQVWEIASVGEEIIHVITLYVVGGYIARTPIKRAPWGWILFGVLLFMTGMHMVKMRFFPISIIYSLHNNSPSLIAATIITFLWARTWQLQSKAVNWFAGGVFAVYLIHTNPYFSPYLWQLMRGIRDAGTYFMTPLYIIGASAAFFCICVFLDKLRAAIFKPVEIWLADRLSKITE